MGTDGSDTRLARFASDKLDLATGFLSDERVPIRERLTAAFVELLPVDPRHLPPDLRERFLAVRSVLGDGDRLARTEATIVARTAALADDDARRLADGISALRAALRARLPT